MNGGNELYKGSTIICNWSNIGLLIHLRRNIGRLYDTLRVTCGRARAITGKSNILNNCVLRSFYWVV